MEYFDNGDMDVVCKFPPCDGLSFKSETGRSAHICCHHGKVTLQPFVDWPVEFTDLIMRKDEVGNHFRQNIRTYNNLFSFASFNAQNVDLRTPGPYSMCIRGKANVRITSSLHSEKKPQFGQVYIYDDNEALKFRTEKLQRDDVIRILQPILNKNPYAKRLKNLNEVYATNQDKEICLEIYKYLGPGEHPRVYNRPLCGELSAIVNSKSGEINRRVEVRVYPKSANESNFIDMSSIHTDALLFPLLFPAGDLCWTYETSSTAKRITASQYYGARLSIRKNIDRVMICQRLSQHYIITSYLKVEQNRLNYIRLNQNKLRCEHIQGLIEHVQNSSLNTSDKYKIGKAFILPATYSGSPRAMQQLYQDAMAIARIVGRPDLFITMTCNPQWPEIKRFLEKFPAGTTAMDIPTFVCRLFHQKCLALLKELEKIFGQIRAYVYTIEFQKRGLPHMHLLVTLHEKLLTPELLDRYVCAEIPDKNNDPDLYNKVIKHMSHGPHTDTSPCWNAETETCSKNYPKPFSDVTDMRPSGFPIYRRRNNKSDCHTYLRKSNGKVYNIDNSMIVPYNPHLLKCFDCHINVEYCASVMSIKYIYKYIHKGNDRAKIVVTDGNEPQQIDEIANYVDYRYLSAMECGWHLMELPMHDRSHNVESLPIHLENQQMVTFTEGCEEDKISKTSVTKLTAFFKLCQIDEHARSLTYDQVPYHYTWDKPRSVWKKRVLNCRIVSRLNVVSSRDRERFHLKLLLRHVKGSLSYKHLRTVNGVQYETFHEAAQALGICKSDNYMREILDEAVSTMMPDQFRKFFIYLCITGDIDAGRMWSVYHDQLIDKSNEAQTLSFMKRMLQSEGMTLQSVGLPEVADDISHLEELIPDSRDHGLLYSSMYHKLNNDQKLAFDEIIKSVLPNSKQKLFFIDGPGGTGKTFLYKCLLHYFKHMSIIAQTIAWTGIAAILLPDGITSHRAFNLPLNYMDSEQHLSWTRRLKETLAKTQVFIWDEASMVPQMILNLIDRTFRDIFDSEEPFAGKCFIFGGDFRQVLPVIKKGGRQQIVQASLKCSQFWPLMTVIKLRKNMRAADSSCNFAEWLLRVGNNEIKNVDISDLKTDDVINELYPNNLSIQQMTDRAILASRNDAVRIINSKILDKIPGAIVQCISADSAESLGGDDTDNENTRLQYQDEYLSTLTPSGFPPAILKLKIGSIVMLLRNLCISNGLCNGTRLVVRKIQRYFLHCEILTGDKKGDIVHIPRITTTSKNDPDMPFLLKRLQFPVRLAFAMTINKSQGQTFDKVGLIIQGNNAIFSHGQLYVAFSRCTTKAGIKIESPFCTITNVVFEEVLS